MPTRFIHSRSSLIPSLVMLPFIQCHQTRGLALLGGFWKPRSSGSPGFCAGTAQAPSKAAAKAVKPSSFTLWSIFIFTLQPTDKVIVAPGSSCGAGSRLPFPNTGLHYPNTGSARHETQNVLTEVGRVGADSCRVVQPGPHTRAGVAADGAAQAPETGRQTPDASAERKTDEPQYR